MAIDIEAEIDAALAAGRSSGGDDLLGLAIDAEHFLGRIPGLDDVVVTRTHDPRCMLRAHATSRDEPASVGAALVSVWETSLRYRAHAQHALAIDGGVVRLRFVTSNAARTMVVTGTIEVTTRRG